MVTANPFLLHESLHLIANTAKASDDPFGFVITRDGDREIGIAGETRFCTHRNCEAADQCEIDRRSRQIGTDALQRYIERRHSNRSAGTIRPGQSPYSAPGRSLSQLRRRRAISSESAFGWRRRRFCRISSRPVSNNESASRSLRVPLVEGMTYRISTSSSSRRLVPVFVIS
jgi:hypothetical protein